MEQQPDREGINNTDDLQERLVTIRDATTLEQCRDLVGGMNNRMQQVVKLQGGHIGKWWKLKTVIAVLRHASLVLLTIEQIVNVTHPA